MSVSTHSMSEETGPLLSELGSDPRLPGGPDVAASWGIPSVDEDFIQRLRRLESQHGVQTSERTALLGVVLAELPGVPFDDVSALLGVKSATLERYMHGESQVPESKARKWVHVAELLDNLHRVVAPAGTAQWLRTSVPDLGGRTPLEAVAKGDTEHVVALTASYLNPAFS